MAACVQLSELGLGRYGDPGSGLIGRPHEGIIEGPPTGAHGGPMGIPWDPLGLLGTLLGVGNKLGCPAGAFLQGQFSYQVF